MAKPRTAFADWTLASRPYDLPPLRLDHIERMTDGTGILQHAHFNVPNFQEGYCTDDNARAFILCNLLGELGGRPQAESLDRLATRYLAFLSAALNADGGRFRNFMSHGRQWLEEEGSEDSHARALWALGTGAGRSRNEGHRKLSARLFEQGLPVVDALPLAPRLGLRRSWASTSSCAASAIIGAAAATRSHLTESSSGLWKTARDRGPGPGSSPAPPTTMPRLCQALLLSGQYMPHPDALEIGLQSLRWLASIQRTREGHFRPIGSNGFYEQGGARAHFDQQPVEAQAMVSACLEAFRATQDPSWSQRGQARIRVVPRPQRSRPAPLRFQHRRLRRRAAARTGSTRTRARNPLWPSTCPSRR